MGEKITARRFARGGGGPKWHFNIHRLTTAGGKLRIRNIELADLLKVRPRILCADANLRRYDLATRWITLPSILSYVGISRKSP